MGCSQCQQIACCNYCGVTADTVELQDKLTGALIGLARATEGNEYLLTASTAAVTVEGLLATRTNVDIQNEALHAILEKVDGEKRKLVPDCYNCVASCGRTDDYDVGKLWYANEDIRSLKFFILFGIRGVAELADYAAGLGYKDDVIHNFLYRALFAVGMEDWGMEELLPIAEEVGQVKRKCREMLDKAGGGRDSSLQLTEEMHSLPPCISAEVQNRLEEK